MKIDYSRILRYYLIFNRNCNMNCIYCVQGQEVKQNHCINKFPPPKTIAQYFPPQYSYDVVFYGGEPFLYFDYMIECAREIKARCPHANMVVTTNATMLDLPKIEKLNSLNFRVNISHDGYVYEKTRKRKDILITHSDVICSLNNFNFIDTITKYNYDYYKNWEFFENFFIKNGLKRHKVAFSVLKDSGGYTPLDLFIYNNKDFENMLDKVMKNLKQRIINKDWESYEFMCYENTFGKILKELTYHNSKSYCGSFDTVLELDVFGNVYDCHNSISPCGKLSDKNFKAICVPYLKQEPCLSCEVKHICLGACPKSSLEAHKYMCYYMKNEYTRLWHTLQELIAEGVVLDDFSSTSL